MSHMLCVVDMQNEFAATNDITLLWNVIKEVKRAKAKKYPVIALEYVGYGKTNEIIKDYLKGYKKVHYVRKTRDNGAHNVAKVINRKNYKTKNIRIVGINIDACVKETAVGLSKIVDRVTIIKNACSTRNCNIDNAWDKVNFVARKNMRII